MMCNQSVAELKHCIIGDRELKQETYFYDIYPTANLTCQLSAID